MLSGVLALLGIGKSYLEGRQALKLKEATANSERKIQAMSDAAKWSAMAAQRSSRFLRWLCAAHLFVGMDFTIYLAVAGDPSPGKIFDAFALLPEWYAGLLATMFGWAFASEPLKAVGGKLVQSWGKRKGNPK